MLFSAMSFCIDPFGSSSQAFAFMGVMLACLTWTAQREHDGQIVWGLHAFYDSCAFLMSWDGGADLGGDYTAFSRALIYIGSPNK